MSVDTGVLEAKTIRMNTAPNVRVRTKKEKPQPQQRTKERLKKIESKAFSETKSVPGVSVFAIFGTAAIAVLMVFVLLAQISYNETASEAVRISSYVRGLEEQHRTLELAFESSFDIREVERIAKDELGMSRPDTAQIMTITTTPRDIAIVVVGEESVGSQGFTEFLESLLGYFKK